MIILNSIGYIVGHSGSKNWRINNMCTVKLKSWYMIASPSEAKLNIFEIFFLLPASLFGAAQFEKSFKNEENRAASLNWIFGRFQLIVCSLELVLIILMMRKPSIKLKKIVLSDSLKEFIKSCCGVVLKVHISISKQAKLVSIFHLCIHT